MKTQDSIVKYKSKYIIFFSYAARLVAGLLDYKSMIDRLVDFIDSPAGGMCAISTHMGQKQLALSKLKTCADSNCLSSAIFSSSGQRQASYCHGLVSVVPPSVRLCPFVCACVHKFCLQSTSPQKLLTGFLPNFTGMFLRWSSFKFLQIIVFHEELWLSW